MIKKTKRTPKQPTPPYPKQVVPADYVQTGSLSLLSLRAANQLRRARWDPDTRLDMLFHSNELAGEVGEACNVVKKLEREKRGIGGSRATIAQLKEELADAVIVVDLLAAKAGINLSDAVVKKFNQTSRKQKLNVFLQLTQYMLSARKGKAPCGSVLKQRKPKL